MVRQQREPVQLGEKDLHRRISMATRYDPDILQRFGDRLYSRANWIIGWYALIGFRTGWLLDFMVYRLRSV